MAKIFFMVLVGMLSISMIFAQEPTTSSPKTCLPHLSKCVGESLQCCKGTTCMFYANKCVSSGGLTFPDELQEPEPAPVEEGDLQTCLPQASKCIGESLECCKGTTCMHYANRCVGI